MFVNDYHSTVTLYCDKVVKEAVQSSSSSPFIANFNLSVNAYIYTHITFIKVSNRSSGYWH